MLAVRGRAVSRALSATRTFASTARIRSDEPPKPPRPIDDSTSALDYKTSHKVKVRRRGGDEHPLQHAPAEPTTLQKVSHTPLTLPPPLAVAACRRSDDEPAAAAVAAFWLSKRERL